MSNFSDLGLDPRLLRALSKRGLTKPTPVQLEAIPKTLEGKDIVARCVGLALQHVHTAADPHSAQA